MIDKLRATVQRHLPSQYLIPILLLVGSSFGCLFALLFHMTGVQDRMERAREQQIVSNAIADAGTFIVHDLQDYAQWDEAVLHLAHRFDADWADDNISTYLGMTQQYSHVFVVDGTDRPLYAFSRNRRAPTPADPVSVIGRGLISGIRDVRRISPGDNPIVSGFSRNGNDIYLYAAAAIVPLTGKVALPPGTPSLIVIASRVDPAFLARLGRGNRALDLALTPIPEQDARDEISLADRDGNALGQIHWAPIAPGTMLRQSILPSFLMICLIALVAAGLVLSRGATGIEALVASRRRTQYLADHDMMTGLPNRRSLIERLKSALTGEQSAILLWMDLDGFKETNDVYGHAVGDALLREAAGRIGMAATEAGATIVARAGGDEFAMLLCHTGISEAKRVSDVILEAFHQPFTQGGHSLSVGISIGIALSTSDRDHVDMIRRADVAMYAAKGAGKNCYAVYRLEMDAFHDRRRLIEPDLHAAILHGEIEVAFQPIVNAADFKVVSVEALARWTHPRHGVVTPDIFIPVAEQGGLINELGRSVLITACRAAADWDVTLSVNLSPAQFWDRSIVAMVREVLNATGFPPHRLELELTENYLLRRPDAAEVILAEMRALGIQMSLDDFGTGYASLGYLRRLSFDRMKIDRSFVRDVANDSKAADMARAMVTLGGALNLPVTAEGIETPDQAEIMRIAGCDRLQGWLFGHPMSAEAMTRCLIPARGRAARVGGGLIAGDERKVY